jgi:hypothetical protein
MSRRTMQGRMIDMDKLISQNELMPAIGNIKVNARGDELGPGGKIIRKREDIVSAYYEDNPAAQPSAIKKANPEKTVTKLEEDVKPVVAPKKTKLED